MTNITSVNKIQNQVAFTMLEQMPFDPNSRESVHGVNLELSDSDDDVVMLVGNGNKISGKGGNNKVCLSGTNNELTVDNGSNAIGIYGTSNAVTAGDGDNYFYIEGDSNKIQTGNRDNIARIYGDNNSFTAGTGKNQLGFIGDGNKINMAGKYASVAFWGDYNSIKVGSTSYVATLDHALKDSQKYYDMEEAWVSELSHFNTSEKVNSNVVYDYSRCTNAAYACMSEADKKFAETVDLLEKKNGKPKYVIGADPNGNPAIYVYSYTHEGHSYYYPRGYEGVQELKVIVDNVETMDVAYEKYDDYTMVYSKNYEVPGVTGNTVEYGDGNNTYKATLQGGKQSAPNMGKAITDHHVKQETYYTFASKSSHDFVRRDVVERKFYTAAG